MQAICCRPSDFVLFFFSFFLRGPCPVTFCSASLLFLLQLPLLWPVSQQLSCWNSQCAGTTKDRFPKAEPQSGFDSSFDNFFFTNTTVTACSFFRSLKVNLRDAFWILGRQLNWNNCWQVVWKGCLSSGVIGFSKGGCVGWSVTAVSHTTNSFFSKGFFLITGLAELFKVKYICCYRNLHLAILVLAWQTTGNFWFLKGNNTKSAFTFFPVKNASSLYGVVLGHGLIRNLILDVCILVVIILRYLYRYI